MVTQKFSLCRKLCSHHFYDILLHNEAYNNEHHRIYLYTDINQTHFLCFSTGNGKVIQTYIHKFYTYLKQKMQYIWIKRSTKQ